MAGTPDFSATQGFQGHDKFASSIATDQASYLARRFPGFDKNRAYKLELRASTPLAAIQSDIVRSGPNSSVSERRMDKMSDQLAVRADAALGEDLWVDPMFRNRIFLSDRLLTAMQAEKIKVRALGLGECTVIASTDEGQS